VESEDAAEAFAFHRDPLAHEGVRRQEGGVVGGSRQLENGRVARRFQLSETFEQEEDGEFFKKRRD
jgi:hypothetical protein